ncbi:hypothetical protein Hamer_G000259 [Homarus americanus]|uniref:BZIP domain-containing protein n=1 Tax=Homarus americanus TaxID=6706 RepID=A0A8J5NCH1_HOMAM|nr:hypothetical protein Hamer_G000259 [Homarus americanus]
MEPDAANDMNFEYFDTTDRDSYTTAGMTDSHAYDSEITINTRGSFNGPDTDNLFHTGGHSLEYQEAHRRAQLNTASSTALTIVQSPEQVHPQALGRDPDYVEMSMGRPGLDKGLLTTEDSDEDLYRVVRPCEVFNSSHSEVLLQGHSEVPPPPPELSRASTINWVTSFSQPSRRPNPSKKRSDTLCQPSIATSQAPPPPIQLSEVASQLSNGCEYHQRSRNLNNLSSREYRRRRSLSRQHTKQRAHQLQQENHVLQVKAEGLKRLRDDMKRYWDIYVKPSTCSNSVTACSSTMNDFNCNTDTTACTPIPQPVHRYHSL